MWFLLHGGGLRPSRHLQRHPHHLLAQTGRTLLFGLCQHRAPQGLPAPMKMELERGWGGKRLGERGTYRETETLDVMRPQCNTKSPKCDLDIPRCNLR
ncbi:hypothetical protein D9C73_016729 [Collichthys lucidus]|uniref:Uncharacterized protein n=1 Tax=Collichthys lucidus TaxID=240159 RepID=A0A4U5V5P6_COLLU|nr:hypothetical protein D9C73_016729 [Collichthys lucidus]